MATTSVISEAKLRSRNQLTLPDPIVQAGGLTEGERFAVEFDADDPDTVRLHRIRPSYAGALEAVYGDAREYLDAQRQGWE